MKLYQALLFFSFLFHRGTEGSLLEKFDECEEEANKSTSQIQSTTESSKHDMVAETVNISNTLLSNMPYISNQFRLNYKTSFQEWLPSFENTTIKTNMKLEYDNYSISFSDITVTKYYGPLFSSVDCEFHEYLQVKIPSMESQLQFRGDIYMNENHNRSISSQFVITFNEIFATITMQKNLTDGVLSHLFNQMKINVDYKNFTIELKVDEHHEMIATSGMGELIEELDSYTKSALKEKFISKLNSTNQSSVHTESFFAMYGTCINPESRIVKAHPGLDSTSKYYYHTKKAWSDKWDSAILTMHAIKANGLSDYKTLKIDAIFLQAQGEGSLNFTWSLGTVRGYANWTYSSPLDERQCNVLKFKMHDLTIVSDKMSTRIRGMASVKVDITTTPTIICAPSNNSLTTYAGAILLQAIKTTIYKDISNAFY